MANLGQSRRRSNPLAALHHLLNQGLAGSIKGWPGCLSVSTEIMSPAMRPSEPYRRQTCLRPGQVALPDECLRRGKPAYSCSIPVGRT